MEFSTYVLKIKQNINMINQLGSSVCVEQSYPLGACFLWPASSNTAPMPALPDIHSLKCNPLHLRVHWI